MSPDNDIRTLSTLGGILKFVGQPVQWLHFDGNAELGFAFFAEFRKSPPSLVSSNPNQNLAINPGGRSRARQRTIVERTKEEKSISCDALSLGGGK